MAVQRPLKLPSRKPRERAESKAFWNDSRTPADADFFTLGYEGRPTVELLRAIKDAGVRTLLDIRFTPFSMYRRDLSKPNLQRSIEDAGMEYVHCPHLGVPKDIRAKAITSGTRNTIWEWYDAEVIRRYFEFNLHWFLNLEHPVAMMCMEHDPEECHRHRIHFALEKHGLWGYDL